MCASLLIVVSIACFLFLLLLSLSGLVIYLASFLPFHSLLLLAFVPSSPLLLTFVPSSLPSSFLCTSRSSRNRASGASAASGRKGGSVLPKLASSSTRPRSSTTGNTPMGMPGSRLSPGSRVGPSPAGMGGAAGMGTGVGMVGGMGSGTGAGVNAMKRQRRASGSAQKVVEGSGSG